MLQILIEVHKKARQIRQPHGSDSTSNNQHIIIYKRWVCEIIISERIFAVKQGMGER